MAQFDPRRQPLRFAPHLITAAAAIVVTALIWRVVEPAEGARSASPDLDPTAIAALESKAFAAASARPGFGEPLSVPVKLRAGETVAHAVVRLGVATEDAQAAAKALAQANVRAIGAFQAAIERPLSGSGAARLVGLTLRTSPASSLTLSRTYDGAMKLRELQERVSDETTVAHGRVAGSLYQSAAALGATSQVTNQVVKLFQHRLDFSRDVVAGDQFTMVFDRRVTESGRTVEIGHLLYAELDTRAKGKPVRLYRFDHNGKTEYFDETGKNIKGLLLRTPVDGAHMTSTYGMRMHPILGFMRMHQGIDFGAGMGTPVLAAGDGVVVEARRWGGYGNWLRIRHSGGWETGYGHLSRYARGIHPGTVVHQGEVVAYVGSTGNSTGPHLHYETWFKGKRVNPIGAKVPQGTVLAGRELAAFKVVKAQIDSMISKKETEQAKTQKAAVEGLRPALSAKRS
jgi:murein DD-endopeptidase MepM/ murein hydrolase activator NlpD